MKRIAKIFIFLLISLLISSLVLASTPVSKGDATMKLVEDNICEIQFGESGSFTKKMTTIDTDNKTVDITLTALNNSGPSYEPEYDSSDLPEMITETVEATNDVAGEVVLLIDSSNSMSVNYANIDNETITRKQLVLNAANSLVDKLFTANSNIKIGVVEFSTSTDVSKEGTDDDAKVITALSNNSTNVKNALTTVATDAMGPRTDIQVGLETADSVLSASSDSSVKKYIILLTDAIPNTSRGVTFDTYSDATAVPTKNTLISLKEKGITVISMLLNMSDSQIQASQESPKPTYKQVAEKIFGTVTSPTAGPVYYIEDKDVVATVTESIYRNLVPETTTQTIEKDIPYAQIRNYLGMFSELNYYKNKNTETETLDNDDIIMVARTIYGSTFDGGIPSNLDATEITKVIDAFYSGSIEKTNDVVNATGKYFNYTSSTNTYNKKEIDTNELHGKCLAIKDLSYDNGVYTIKFVYCFINSTLGNISQLVTVAPHYSATAKIKVNDDTTSSYFKLISLTDGTYIEPTRTKASKLTDIVIKDYFPKNIVDNFKYASLVEATKGNVTSEIDDSDNSITWTISELEAGEVATFTYRISLKNTFDSEIVGKNLPTNQNVTIDYKEDNVQGEQVENNKCPIIALDVLATKDIPQTGSNTWIIVGTLVTLSMIIGFISFKGYTKKKIK